MSDKLQFVVTHEEGLRQIEVASSASGNDKLKAYRTPNPPTKVPILAKIAKTPKSMTTDRVP